MHAPVARRRLLASGLGVSGSLLLGCGGEPATVTAENAPRDDELMTRGTLLGTAPFVTASCFDSPPPRSARDDSTQRITAVRSRSTPSRERAGAPATRGKRPRESEERAEHGSAPARPVG